MVFQLECNAVPDERSSKFTTTGNSNKYGAGYATQTSKHISLQIMLYGKGVFIAP